MDKLVELLQKLAPARLRGARHVCDEAPLAPHRGDAALLLKLAVGALDGVGIHGKARRELANRGELLSRCEHARKDLLAVRVAHLLVDGARVLVADMDHGTSRP